MSERPDRDSAYKPTSDCVTGVTSVAVDAQLVERARELTGEKSNRAVLELALRRLIASKQKSEMVDGILGHRASAS